MLARFWRTSPVPLRAAAPLHVLVVTPAVPGWDTGDRGARSAELVTRLAVRHRVDVLALPGGPGAPHAYAELAERGVDVEVVPAAALGAALARRVATGGYDVVHCDSVALGALRPPGGPPWLLDAGDVDGDEVAAAASAADHVVVRTEAAGAAVGTPVTVVPHGVDVDVFRPRPGRNGPDDGGAVLVGRMDDARQRDGMRWFCTRVLPLVRAQLPTFRVTLVHPHPAVADLAACPGVAMGLGVPDLRQFLWSSAVAVAAVPSGTGTGSSAHVAVLEAMAAGRATVVTPAAVAGLDVADDVHVSVANEPAAVAARLVELVMSPARRHRLGERARALVEQRYAWDAVVGAAERAWRATAARAATHTA